MGKYEKRDGIPPVPVRRNLQSEENYHHKSTRRARWRGRYPEIIHIEVRRLRAAAKRCKEERRELYRGRGFIPFEHLLTEWAYRDLERAIKAGYRAAKEGRECRYPLSPTESYLRERNNRWLRDYREAERAWYYGYDLLKKD